ncbi:MAG: hypothetical protein IJI46_10020 [Erysipelotrichaceae bacterium]|nr:hypothetical protein [Erysipelotrichaceae bacterium]
MTKKERIYAAVKGEKCDRLPYAIWTHLPGIDMDPVRLAQETYNFYKEYDTDLIKTMNNGMYAIEDFGCEVDYSQIAKGGVAKLISTPINSIDDWSKIKPLKLEECKALQRELYSLKLLLEKVKDEEVPVIFTVFSPFTIANKLRGGKILEDIATGETKQIHEALQMIADLTSDLVKEAIGLGADGVFFASQMSSYDVTSVEVFKEFGVPYDHQVLKASTGQCDTIHCHGTNIMFEILKDYPVDIFNWHAWESLPSLEDVRQANKCIMGGLDRRDITDRNFDKIEYQIKECLRVFDKKEHILAPGCVIRYPLDSEMLKFIKQTADRLQDGTN